MKSEEIDNNSKGSGCTKASLEDRIQRLENVIPHAQKRRYIEWITEIFIAGIIIFAGALVIYPPIKDLFDTKGELALKNAEKVQVESEINNLKATLQNEMNMQERSALEKKIELNAN